MATLSSEERYFVENADLEVALAISKAMANWPKIEPDMIKTPALIYAGTDDEPTHSILKKQAKHICRSNIELHLIDGLNHFQAISEKEIIMPIVKSFLAKHSAQK